MPYHANDNVRLQTDSYIDRLNHIPTGDRFTNHTALFSACIAYAQFIPSREKARMIRVVFLTIIRLVFDTTNPSERRFLTTVRERHEVLFPEIMDIMKDVMSINKMMDEKDMIDTWFINTLG